MQSLSVEEPFHSDSRARAPGLVWRNAIERERDRFSFVGLEPINATARRLVEIVLDQNLKTTLGRDALPARRCRRSRRRQKKDERNAGDRQRLQRQRSEEKGASQPTGEAHSSPRRGESLHSRARVYLLIPGGSMESS